MSGINPERKMKRKRKTREERNQMSRHHLQDKEKQKKVTKSLNIDPCHNTIYTLRSGRGSHPSLVPRDDRKAKGGTITQGRLTRSLGKLTFTNSKTSDWITRGPISESEAMKEKVESDIKRILRLAERSTLTGNVDQGICCLQDSTNRACEINKTAESEQDVMEVDCPANNSVVVDKNALDISHQKEATGEITLPSKAAIIPSAVQAQVTPIKSGNSFAWASTSQNITDETLELEPPVQDIADKILRELKPKFARMFPNRDIEMEMCSDLQKLLNHSCCYSEDVQVDPELISYLPRKFHDPVNLCTPLSYIPTTSSSTLSVCRPPKIFPSRQLYKHGEEDAKLQSNGSAFIPDTNLFPCVNKFTSSTYHKESAASSFTTTFVVPELPEMENVIKINVNVDESEDDNDFLSTARYNAFLASARELELEQEKLMHRVSSFEGINPSHTSNYHQDNFLRQSCGLGNNDTVSRTLRSRGSNSCSFPWKSVSAARVLNFSQPSGGHKHQDAPSSCPSRDVVDNLCPNIHVCRSVMRHNNQFDHLINSASEQPQYSFINQGYSPGGVYTCCQDERWTCQKPRSSPVSKFVKRNTTSKIGTCLVQSRLNFQNALKVACRLDGVSHVKSTECMDTNGCDDFLSSIQRKNSPSESCCFSDCKQLMARPLSELQGHQADLQQQARDFLDDLGRCGTKSRQDLINNQPTSHARHLFRMSSPDSNGSPVWGMHTAMKDFSLETGSFV